jgi:hypothetical protein
MGSDAAAADFGTPERRGGSRSQTGRRAGDPPGHGDGKRPKLQAGKTGIDCAFAFLLLRFRGRNPAPPTRTPSAPDGAPHPPPTEASHAAQQATAAALNEGCNPPSGMRLNQECDSHNPGWRSLNRDAHNTEAHADEKHTTVTLVVQQLSMPKLNSNDNYHATPKPQECQCLTLQRCKAPTREPVNHRETWRSRRKQTHAARARVPGTPAPTFYPRRYARAKQL